MVVVSNPMDSGLFNKAATVTGGVGEDPDERGWALDLLVDSLQGVGEPDLAPLGLEEGCKRKEPGLRLVRQGTDLRERLVSWSRTSSQAWLTASRLGGAKTVRNTARILSA